MDFNKLQETTKAFYDILMDFHQENSDIYPRDGNWHKDFINMPIVIKALEKAYSDNAPDIKSRWEIFKNEILESYKTGRLFVKYTDSDFPPKEHRNEIIKKFAYEFFSINGSRLTTK